MAGVNKVILLGYLGGDGELGYTPSGVPLIEFSLATTRRFQRDGDWQEDTQWHSCLLWRREQAADRLKKGALVHVEGRLDYQSWEGQDGRRNYRTRIVVERLQFCDRSDRSERGERNGGGDERRPRAAAAARSRDEDRYVDEDDVPF